MTLVSRILETQALSKSFGGVVAVDGIDFSLNEGELRCLIGPNGAGKSTFFKLLTGQLQPSAGRIVFRGDDITGAESHEIARHGVGIKTQVPNLFDGLSVYENLRLAARRHTNERDGARVVDEILTCIRMQAKATHRAGELAHGERQWVELGMVLGADPQVAATAELIRSLCGGRAWIVVEHDMQFVRMIAERVSVFHEGRTLMEAQVDEVMRDRRVRDIYLGKHIGSATT
jgi:branched-chain amino acid transport system ATP-binding protein